MANNQQQMPRGAPFARSIMAHNPHWDETINEDITITDLPPWSPQEEWADVGGGGEFSGSRREEVLPSVNMPGSWRGGPEGYENYPADEFIGIQSNVPSSGTLKKIFENIYPRIENYIQKQRQLMEDYYNQYKPGPWNEFNPSSPQYPSLKQDWGEGLMAYNPGDETSGPIRRPRIKPLTIEEEELDLVDILEGLEPEDELDPDDYYSDGWDVADIGNYDLFHLMQNGYSLEEAQQILNEQGLA